jgi:hypothetical protein
MVRWADTYSVWSSAPNQEALASAVSNGTETRTAELDNLAVLQAPATEIVTAVSIDSDFPQKVRDFGAKMDAAKLKGYHGAAVLKVNESLDGKGDALMMVIGWDSKEVHEEAKATPGNGKFSPAERVGWA